MRCSGFTLVESLMAAAILAIAVAAIAQAITAGHAQSIDSLHRVRAVALAESMMEEILSKPYRDPSGTSALGPETGETKRAEFDNIDDYHGYPKGTDPGTADIAGASYGSEYAGFTRRVTASYTTTQTGPRGGADTVPGLLINVVVKDDRGREWMLTRFVEAPK